MAGKRSNGEGQILYDKRRKTYRARVTVGWEFDEEKGKYKQITKSLGSYKTKGEAASALAEYIKTPYSLENKDITFAELYAIWFDAFIEDHESHRYRIKSAYKYCASLYEKKFRNITITDMKNAINKGTAECVRGKYKGEQRLATPSVKESMKYLFNHIYEYAVECRIVEHNYAKEFTLDKKVFIEKEINHKIKTPFTDEEMELLWKGVDIVPFADMIVYACYSGWRPTEICELKIADVDLENGYISGGIKTAAGKNRIVPIHPLVKDIVKRRYDGAIRLGSPYLFNDAEKKKGIGLSYDQYLTRFNNAMYLFKLSPSITPHYTRHTFVTKCKAAGMNEYILKLIAGHRIKDITEEIYTHRSPEELKQELLKIKK